jgi:hypothetical protein
MSCLHKKRRFLLKSLVLSFCLLTSAVQICADGHRIGPRHLEYGYEQGDSRHRGESGPSGEIAALLLVIANIPVVLSLLLKASAKITSRPGLADAILKINNRQKKYLKHLHYWLNPVAIALAIMHYSGVECSSTAFPELGFGAMLLISILGLMMIFKFSPAFMRKSIVRVHTSPIVLIAVFAILMIGHSMID